MKKSFFLLMICLVALSACGTSAVKKTSEEEREKRIERLMFHHPGRFGA